MSRILDGRVVRAELKKNLTERIKGLSIPPKLAIVQVGDRSDSNFFISAKMKFAAQIGAEQTYVKIPDTPAAPARQQEVIRIIENLDADPSIHGIIVQLPLPLSLDKDAVLAAISPEKDVDGLTMGNVQGWLCGRRGAIWPATARGIHELLNFYDISLVGKHVVVVGRSSLVGKPIAAMCLGENATVTVCHSKTPNLADYTRQADVLIVAIGKSKYINASYIKPSQVIIDVGTTDVGGVLTGDVDFEAVKDVVSAITPVPGGVGQMTVLALFENLVDSVMV